MSNDNGLPKLFAVGTLSGTSAVKHDTINLFNPTVRKFMLMELQRLSESISQNKVKKNLLREQLEEEIKELKSKKDDGISDKFGNGCC